MTNTSDQKREPKKTVSIEVRVSEEDKHDFMEACRSTGRSASSALRELMRLFVVLHHTRHRMLEMMKRLIFRPVRAALASMTAAAALSASLILAPTASADMAYMVAVGDGTGVIVSMGEADFAGDEAVTDQLGEDVHFRLSGPLCEAESGTACSDGQLMLSVTEYREDQVFTASDLGIDVAETGETRFETELSDGRTLIVRVMPQR